MPYAAGIQVERKPSPSLEDAGRRLAEEASALNEYPGQIPQRGAWYENILSTRTARETGSVLISLANVLATVGGSFAWLAEPVRETGVVLLEAALLRAF